MAPFASVLDFIDRGDSCNDAPSSVGDYDTQDSFINDEGSQIQSPLFCTPAPSVRQSIEPHSNLRRLSRLFSADSSSSRESLVSSHGSGTPLLRRRELLARARQSRSPFTNGGSRSQSVRSDASTRRDRRRPSGSSASRASIFSTRSARSSASSAPRSHSDSDDGGESSDSDDLRPFTVPEHIDVQQLGGVGVARKRLGSNKPRYAGHQILLRQA